MDKQRCTSSDSFVNYFVTDAGKITVLLAFGSRVN